MTITNEDKQKILFATIIRYSSETTSLRERILEQFVLQSLEGTHKGVSHNVKNIRRELGNGLGINGINSDLIVDSLGKLSKDGLIEIEKKNYKNHYYLTKRGNVKVSTVQKNSSSLVSPAIRRMLASYDEGDEKIAEEVCKRFVINCFVDYGHNIAVNIVSNNGGGDISEHLDFEKTFNSITCSYDLTDDEYTSLKDRCLCFLKSNEPEDEALKYQLTQVYYVSKLFELSPREFKSLDSNMFNGSRIIIDSNVILNSMLNTDESNYIVDLVKFSEEVGLTLYFTTESMEEIKRVLETKTRAIQKIVSKTPSRIYERVDDVILQEYLSQLSKNPELTRAEFRDGLLDLDQRLLKAGIKQYDAPLDSELAPSDIHKAQEIIDKYTIKKYGKKTKTKNVCRHDALHLLTVKKLNEDGVKSWFLTQDTLLNDVSKEITGNKFPLVFSLPSLLHWVTPYAEGVNSETLYHLYSKVIGKASDGISASGLFELNELKIICAHHEDILSTSPEQLTKAFEYVKKSILRGKEITESNHSEVILEIKKYLYKTSDEEKKQLARKVQQEEEARRATQKQLSVLEGERNKDQESIKVLSKKLSDERKVKVVIRSLIFFLIAIPSIFLWFYDSEVINFLSPLSKNIIGNEWWLRLIGLVVFVLTSTPLILLFSQKWLKPSLIVTIVTAIYLSKIFNDSLASTINNTIGIALVIIAVILFFFVKEKE